MSPRGIFWYDTNRQKSIVAPDSMHNTAHSKTTFSILFVLFSLLYLTTTRGVLYCNDGSQMSLVRSIAEEQSFSINSFVHYTKKVDYAYNKGNYFSDRPIGSSLLALPAYVLTQQTLYHLGTSWQDSARYAEQAAIISLMCYGALGAALLYLLLTALGLSLPSAITTAVIYGTTSLHWKYSSLFMAHAPSATTVIIILWLICKRNPERTSSLLFFLMGFLPLIRYEAALLLPFLGILWLIRSPGRFFTLGFCNPIQALTALSCFATPLLFLAYYNTVCFGGPLETFSAFYAPDRNFFGHEPQFEKSGGAFTYRDIFYHPFLTGLLKVLFQFPGHNEYSMALQAVVGTGAWGLITLHPSLFFIPVGIIVALGRQPKEYTTLLALLISSTCFVAMLWVQDGGGMHDPRFIMMALPAFYIFLAHTLEWCSYTSNASRHLLSALLWISISAGLLLTAIHFIDSDELRPRFDFRTVAAESLISKEFISSVLERLFLLKYFNHLGILFALLMSSISVIAVYLLRAVRNEIILLITACFSAWCCGNIYGLHQSPQQLVHHNTISVADRVATKAVQEVDFPLRRHTTIRPYVLSCKSALVVRPRSFITIPLRGDETAFSTWIKVTPTDYADRLIARHIPTRLKFTISAGSASWRSARMGVGSLPQFVLLPLHGARTLTLRVHKTSMASGVIGSWCNPHFANSKIP